MSRDAQSTALGPMVLVAVEQHFPAEQRIVDDPLAAQMLPPHLKVLDQVARHPMIRDWLLHRVEHALPGLWAAVLCRKRYLDEITRDCAVRGMPLIHLGAGLDTRALRIPELRNLPAIDIDHPTNVELKARRLRASSHRMPDHFRLVAVDFETQLIESTVPAPTAQGDPVVVIWEAVTQYLTAAAVDATFDYLASAPPSSVLAFTYVRADFLEGEELYGAADLYDRFVKRSRMWKFGLTPEHLAQFLTARGWHLDSDVTYGDLVRQYVRPTGRHLESTPIERVAVAVRT